MCPGNHVAPVHISGQPPAYFCRMKPASADKTSRLLIQVPFSTSFTKLSHSPLRLRPRQPLPPNSSTEMSAADQSQNEAANRILWNDPKFAARYKIGERFTGEYAHDLCLQMGIQSYSAPIHFLDLACGTGIVIKKAFQSQACARYRPCELVRIPILSNFEKSSSSLSLSKSESANCTLLLEKF